MKKNIFYMLLMSGLIASIAGCKKESNDTTVFDGIQGKAKVQYYNATVGSLRNFIYVNGKPANGATVAYGAMFPASSLAFTVDPGNLTINIKDTLSTSTQLPINFDFAFEADKTYTIFAFDTITAPSRMIVANTFTIPDNDTTAMLRFGNFIYHPTPSQVPNVDVYSARKKAIVFQNIPTAGLTNFAPFTSGVSDTLTIRPTGTTTSLITIPMNLMKGRSYTAVYRGSYRTAATRGSSIIVHN